MNGLVTQGDQTMNCPKCRGLLVQEEDNLAAEATLEKRGYKLVVRGAYRRCVNCGYQTDRTMEGNRHGTTF